LVTRCKLPVQIIRGGSEGFLQWSLEATVAIDTMGKSPSRGKREILKRTARKTMARSLSRLPPLNALRAFVVAAKHLSFSKAAAELFVTPAAVSQQVRQLEEHLGCALFRRGPRNLMLTDEGQACLPGLNAAFEGLAQALAEIDAAGARGALTVSVAPSFAAKWLVPRLERFAAAYPDISVRVSASVGLTDFEADAIDCAIRYGAGGYAGLHAEHLLDERVVPVASPSLLEGPARLESAGDLSHFTLLHDDSPDLDPSCPTWTMWLRAAGAPQIDAQRGLHFNTSSLVIEAAIAGQGVALAKERLAEGDLAAGRLVPVFAASQPLTFAYWFVCPPEKLSLAKVQAFRTWLRETAAASSAA
jgi:LysR family glycine cleavage system transcriptional activator